MARKGSQKVRTGCLTCKVRKVKCDESKPYCQRCASTGRRCDGYAVRPPGSYSWSELLAVRPSQPSPSSAPLPSPPLSLSPSWQKPGVPGQEEGRALQFFREVVAPMLAGYSSEHFWTRLVMLVGYQEPAVRHAVVAISAMYEQLQEDEDREADDDDDDDDDGGEADDQVMEARSVMAVAVAASAARERRQQHQLLNSPRGRFAIANYSLALQLVREGRGGGDSQPDERVVLFICILFVCIEILQGNRDAAIGHCRYGVRILNDAAAAAAARRPTSLTFAPFRTNCCIRANVLPMFARLSVMPFFFGSNVDTFPGLSEAMMRSAEATTVNATDPGAATTLDEICFTLDLLLARAIRFIRSTDAYSLGDRMHEPVPAQMYVDQQILLDLFDRWLLRFEALKVAAAAETPSKDPAQSYLLLHMKSLVVRVWLSVTLNQSETVYDNYMADFATIVNLAEQTIASLEAESRGRKPKFVFEMGYLPLLYFVVIKCRRLSLRCAALSAMRRLAIRREGLWEADALFAIGRRVIEKEHEELLLRGGGGGSYASDALPPDEKRIRDSRLGRGIELGPPVRAGGQPAEYRRALFIYPHGTPGSPDYRVGMVEELVRVRPAPAPTVPFLEGRWETSLYGGSVSPANETEVAFKGEGFLLFRHI